jgi:hypothetical protein
MFLIKKRTEKIYLVIILVIFIFSTISIPLQTKAEYVLTQDIILAARSAAQWARENAFSAWEKSIKLREIAVRTVQTRLLREITKAVVKWIDSGFKGNPAFITDTGKFLQDTADITIGDMLLGTELDFLCDPFKLQVKLSLGLQYRPFTDEIKCSLTGVLKNIDGAMNDFTNGDFIGGGGWDSWLQITTIPQNNQMGAMMIAQSELDARISGNKEIQLTEAGWGGGFMSWKECETVQAYDGDTGGYDESVGDSSVDGEGNSVYEEGPGNSGRVAYYNSKGDVAGTIQENQKCTIQTPGSTIANKLDWADSSDIRKAELANDVNAITNALLNQLVLKVTNEMSSLLKRSGGNSRGSTARADNIDYLYSLQDQLDAQNNYSGGGTYTNPNTGLGQASASRSTALAFIEEKSIVENKYFLAQQSIDEALNKVRRAFASSTCSDSIKTPIINQIEGSIAYDKTAAGNLVWNVTNTRAESGVATSNILALDNIAKGVRAASSESAIPSIMSPIANMALHTTSMVTNYSAGGTTYNQVKTWLTNKINSSSCVRMTVSDLGM